MDFVSVEIKNKSKYPLPKYETILSAGMDLRANIDERKFLEPGEWDAIPTGIYIKLPAGYEAQIRPRSGLAYNKGVTVLNAPGTIDADYRGEIKVILINHSEGTRIVEPGDRIAQMVVAKHACVIWKSLSEGDDFTENDYIPDTWKNYVGDIEERGTGGFGHTGEK